MVNEQTGAALEAEQTTAAHSNEMALEQAQSMQLDKSQAEKMAKLQELSLRAGRVQAAKLICSFAEGLTVSQLRELKELSRELGITWVNCCERIGISSKTADQYLRYGNDLGDDFVADVRRVGVSIRVLEQARALPEPVRQRLINGEIVDLEQASREQLTGVIRDLAAEHAKEKTEVEAALKKETKARERAEDKAKRLDAECQALQEGLPAEDSEALTHIQEQERAAVAFLVRVKNTLNIHGRDPHFTARLVNSLALIGSLAEATANAVQARAEGREPQESLGAEARELNDLLAEADKRAPHPGV